MEDMHGANEAANADDLTVLGGMLERFAREPRFNLAMIQDGDLILDGRIDVTPEETEVFARLFASDQ